MRTSVDLPDHLFALAKQKAAQDGTSLREVLVDSLSRYLIQTAAPTPAANATPWRFPVLAGEGGTLPGIDPADSSALLEIE